MMDIYTIQNTLLSWLYDGNWILVGTARAMIILVIARIAMYAFSEHRYLFQRPEGGSLLDTWITALLPLVKKLPLRRYRASATQKLAQSGARGDLTSDHLIAKQAIYAVAALLLSFVTLCLMMGVTVWIAFIAGVIGATLPWIKLCDMASFRVNRCHRDLPFFVDYLALTFSAGVDFNQAVRTVVYNAPDSPLKGEFQLLLRNISLGMSRSDALNEMQSRLNIPVFKLFAQTLSQGLELGTNVNTILSAMSENIQRTRFQKAEERAGKISVRIMLPTMMFIMPAVLIVLLGPLAITYFINS